RRRNGQSQHQRRRIPSRMELHNLASLTQNLNVTRLFRGVALVTAIAALGMKTSFKDLAAVGWRPIAVMVLETAWIAATTFIAVSFAY
ncbi:MAG: hypothetical protein ACLP4V_06530, partial [Methylocella sp.]